MSPKSFLLTDVIERYLASVNGQDPVLQALVDETSALGSIAGMQIAPEQGAFLTQFVHVIGARTAIELGTFTGYSSICIARGLGPQGRLIACDISDEWTSVARKYWKHAGVADRIELRLAPALETLAALGPDDMFDFAFIDAVKLQYGQYFDALLPHLSERGVMVVDNVLWSGRVADDTDTDEETVAIRAFNAKVAADSRVHAVMLPIADGLTFITHAWQQ